MADTNHIGGVWINFKGTYASTTNSTPCVYPCVHKPVMVERTERDIRMYVRDLKWKIGGTWGSGKGSGMVTTVSISVIFIVGSIG